MKRLLRNKKRFGITLLLAVFIVCALSMNVFAAYVAKIGTKKYKTMQGAVNAAKNGQTITVLGEITASKTVTVSGKTIAINFARKKYTYSPKTGFAFNLKSGKLTFKNLYVYSNSGAVKVASGAGLTINNGYMIGYVENRGTMLVRSGTFRGAGTEEYQGDRIRHPAIRNYGSVTIRKGAYAATNSRIIVNSGKMIIYDGTFKAKRTLSYDIYDWLGAIENIGTSKQKPSLRIEGGTFVGPIKNDFDGEGQLMILGGTFSAESGKPAIHNSEGEILITGGKFTGKNYAAVANRLEESGLDHSVVVIAGGTFISTGGNHGTIINSGELVITGGTFSHKNGKGVVICYVMDDNWGSCSWYFSSWVGLKLVDNTQPPEDW